MLQRWCNLFELQIIVDKANMAAAWLCQTGKTKRPRSSRMKRPPHEYVRASTTPREVFELLPGVPIDLC